MKFAFAAAMAALCLPFCALAEESIPDAQISVLIKKENTFEWIPAPDSLKTDLHGRAFYVELDGQTVDVYVTRHRLETGETIDIDRRLPEGDGEQCYELRWITPLGSDFF